MPINELKLAKELIRILRNHRKKSGRKNEKQNIN